MNTTSFVHFEKRIYALEQHVLDQRKAINALTEVLSKIATTLESLATVNTTLFRRSEALEQSVYALETGRKPPRPVATVPLKGPGTTTTPAKEARGNLLPFDPKGTKEFPTDDI